MDRTATGIMVGLALLSLSVLVSTWLYTERTRFGMIEMEQRAYRIDRVTGEMWLVNDAKYGPVEGPVNYAD